MKKNFIVASVDGNAVVADIAYYFSEVACIFPISPSTPMAETVDAMANANKTNFFGNKVNVFEFQSEGGAAGGVHGALQAGSFATTFTASQGLLLMIPNIYKWKGELLPAVIHVAARAIASKSLSIFGDHQDIYAVRQTGVILLCSHSVQDCAFITPIAHAIAISASVPVVHFFDGLRTSHEINKINLLSKEELSTFIDLEKVEEFRKRKLSSDNPVTRGSAENDDTYFQGLEAQNLHFNNVIKVAKKYFKQINDLTGKNYDTFTYYGHKDAKHVIVAMGSVTETIEETIDDLKGQKIGLVKVYLYRPFDTETFISVLPKSVTSIAVLNRTKEQGATGEPLYLDVVCALKNHKKIKIANGRYGLSSKDTNPAQIKAVFSMLKNKTIKDEFTIGINDDLTHLSLDYDDSYETKVEKKAQKTIFYGIGSDGTISANKSTIKIVSEISDLFTQAYFAYDSRKAGGLTRSFLRFSDVPIKSTYYIKNADILVCTKDNYLFQYPLIEKLNKNGVFLLNTSFSKDEIITILPNRVKKLLAQKKISFYIIDANKIANKIGIPGRISTIMQSAYFKLLSKVVPFEKAIVLMKKYCEKAYGKKGRDIVEINYQAIDLGYKKMTKIKVLEEWKTLEFQPITSKKTNDSYVDDFVRKIDNLQGYELPVSKFLAHKDFATLDGTMRNDVTFKIERKIAENVPTWIPEKCIQCNRCAVVCPHATIRAFLLDDLEIKNAPKEFKTLDAIGAPKYQFRIQVNAEDCVGCALCATECPVGALKMTPIKERVNKDRELTEYLYKKTEVKKVFSINSFKGFGFLYPYIENHGACAGCGEAPYYKMLTMLFGKDMIIANGTGCTSIYGGSFPYSPFATDKDNEGPSWANSLFEDNAEFGFGMRLSLDVYETKLRNLIMSCINDESINKDFCDVLNEFLTVDRNNRDRQRELKAIILKEAYTSKNLKIKELYQYKDYLVRKSLWLVGGDGWSYDIGFSGLDHVMASGKDINILVLDTQVYSNTGGQASKSTDITASAGLSIGGKKTNRKDLARMLMTYKNVYVGQIAMGMNPNQAIKTFIEAENFDGPSIIIAYSPCIAHGIKGGMRMHQEIERLAVKSGYWPIFRYNPDLLKVNKNPLILDYKKPDFSLLYDFLNKQRRFSIISEKKPELFSNLFIMLKKYHIDAWNELNYFANREFNEQLFDNATEKKLIFEKLNVKG
ncbi:pyruvate:ferredoxin (flavodoxin) oxidoreductase [symbiont of Argiope bruennichi]|uniref:pyruvate:ferredoxin (flavodoxin) oxidoreductase n=1 Tax=symbiont of Argiope bruennichi TaxID=2810479 RepID=UPI003DA63B85